MAPVPMETIVDKTLKGIARAQDDYETWTGGSWLWEAPEYLVTSYIAREIATVEGYTYYLTLESGVKDALDFAGGRVDPVWHYGETGSLIFCCCGPPVNGQER